MPSLTWRSWLSYRLAGPLAVALAVLVVATNEAGFRAAEEVTARRDAAVEMRQAVGRVRRAVLLMESAQRGYMLTGRPEYREPYDEARTQVAPLVDSLRALAERTPAQREALRQLAEVSLAKFSELAEVMRLYESGERDRALALLLTDIGREQMERLNALTDAVVAAEDAAYAASGRQRERVRFWSRLAIVSLVLLCLGTVVAAIRLARERERERSGHLADLAAERDKLEHEVARRTDDLTRLARHLQTVREDERSRLARELHDELGGLLTAAKLDVARVRKRLADAGPEIAERIDHLGQSLDAGIALKRRIIEDLRPSSLAHLGLARALEIQCAEFAQRAELKVQAQIDEVPLAGERALAVYRFVQEALTNVAKYAKATSVQVSLARDGEHALVEVKDDGVGFDPAAIAPASQGLAGMRFRIHSCGGQWRLDAVPGQGVALQARVPL